MKEDKIEESFLNIIWIAPNVFLSKNVEIYKDLRYYVEHFCYGFEKFKITRHMTIKEAMKNIKKLKFQHCIIIIDESLYYDLIVSFINNLNDIYIIPEIIIHSPNENSLKYILSSNNFDKIVENKYYYHFDERNISYKNIKNFILNRIDVESGINLNSSVPRKKLNDGLNNDYIFEKIDTKEQLLLPMFYKTLLDSVEEDKENSNENFIKNLYTNCRYGDLKDLLKSCVVSSEIPTELLSKYYAIMFTSPYYFYTDVNKDLRNNKFKPYLPFIKTLYRGVELESLPLATNIELFRGGLLSNKEIESLKYYLDNKKKFLPGAIVFSKVFLSFSKNKSTAKEFLEQIQLPNGFSKVLFNIKKKENYNNLKLSTHAYIKNVSYFPKEEEVLFFPFSSFEVKSIEPDIFNNEKIKKIDLEYLGKYLKEFEIESFINKNIVHLPETKFKKHLEETDLIKTEKLDKINDIEIITNYENYKINLDIDKSNKVNKFRTNLPAPDELDPSTYQIHINLTLDKILENRKKFPLEIYRRKINFKTKWIVVFMVLLVIAFIVLLCVVLTK